MNALRLGPLKTSVWLFIFIWLSCQAQAIAQSPVPPSATSNASQRFASVLRIRGNVNAVDPRNGQSRALREGDPVLVGEQVKADSTGEAILRTDDAGFVALRPGGVFIAESYSAQGNASDNMSLRVVVGALRIVTGWIGTTNRAGARVLTPTATIGIRGTDHEPVVMTVELSEQTL